MDIMQTLNKILIRLSLCVFFSCFTVKLSAQQIDLNLLVDSYIDY